MHPATNITIQTARIAEDELWTARLVVIGSAFWSFSSSAVQEIHDSPRFSLRSGTYTYVKSRY